LCRRALPREIKETVLKRRSRAVRRAPSAVPQAAPPLSEWSCRRRFA